MCQVLLHGIEQKQRLTTWNFGASWVIPHAPTLAIVNPNANRRLDIRLIYWIPGRYRRYPNATDAHARVDKVLYILWYVASPCFPKYSIISVRFSLRIKFSRVNPPQPRQIHLQHGSESIFLNMSVSLVEQRIREKWSVRDGRCVGFSFAENNLNCWRLTLRVIGGGG